MDGQVLEYEAKILFNKGKEEGREEELYALVHDGLLELDTAAGRLKKTREEFEDNLRRRYG